MWYARMLGDYSNVVSKNSLSVIGILTMNLNYRILV